MGKFQPLMSNNKNIMTNPICKYCGEQAVYKLTPYLNPRKKELNDPDYYFWTGRDPEYLFHIGIVCVFAGCKKFSGWVPQTPELMQHLKGAYLISQQQADAAIDIQGAESSTEQKEKEGEA